MEKNYKTSVNYMRLKLTQQYNKGERDNFNNYFLYKFLSMIICEDHFLRAA